MNSHASHLINLLDFKQIDPRIEGMFAIAKDLHPFDASNESLFESLVKEIIASFMQEMHFAKRGNHVFI